MSDSCNCFDIEVEVMMDEPEIDCEIDVADIILCSDGEDYKRGYEEGHAQGFADGQADGYNKGYNEGHIVGSKLGYSQGKQDGLTEGYDNGYAQGKADGYTDGYEEGYSKGYEQGLIDGTKEEQEKFVTITKNGTTEIVPDDNKVLSKITVEVDVADSYYDTFWDAFQQNGERTNYANYTFGNSSWTDDTFKPKYDINVIQGDSMFRRAGSIDLIQRLKDNNLTFNTSEATVLSYCFYDSSITTVPTVSVAKIKTATHLFFCNTLHTIEKFIVHSNFTIGNIFNVCRALQNIVIEGEIGNTVDIKVSPLTSNSAKSIITHLVNYSGTENEFTYTIIFSPTTWGYLDAEGETASPNGNTWREYINDLGWNAS